MKWKNKPYDCQDRKNIPDWRCANQIYSVREAESDLHNMKKASVAGAETAGSVDRVGLPTACRD